MQTQNKSTLIHSYIDRNKISWKSRKANVVWLLDRAEQKVTRFLH